MELSKEKNRDNIFIKIIYFLLFLLFLIILSKFFLGKVNDQVNYLFGLAYFVFLILSFQYILKDYYDQKTLTIWIFQLNGYVLFLFLEYHTIVKIYIIIQMLIGLLLNYRQINLFKNKNKKIKYLSFHDEMTGLHNRRYFENVLAEFNDPAEHNLSVIIADINDLKIINDNHGHKKGDHYIKSAAKLLKSELRQKDIISRIGGDEFAIILPDTDQKTCKQIVKRLKEKIKEHPENNFSIAFGYVHHSHQYNSLEEMVNNADKNMYYNKNKFKAKKSIIRNSSYHVLEPDVHY